MNKKEKAVHEIVDRYKSSTMNKGSMARGILILDENVQHLEEPLKDRNIIIRIPKSGMSDDDIKKDLLSKRIFVTNNSKDFIPDASSYEYGIIATEGVSKDAETLSSMISRALSEHKLWSKRTGFILVLSETGQHRLEDLTD